MVKANPTAGILFRKLEPFIVTLSNGSESISCETREVEINQSEGEGDFIVKALIILQAPIEGITTARLYDKDFRLIFEDKKIWAQINQQACGRKLTAGDHMHINWPITVDI